MCYLDRLWVCSSPTAPLLKDGVEESVLCTTCYNSGHRAKQAFRTSGYVFKYATHFREIDHTKLRLKGEELGDASKDNTSILAWSGIVHLPSPRRKGSKIVIRGIHRPNRMPTLTSTSVFGGNCYGRRKGSGEVRTHLSQKTSGE